MAHAHSIPALKAFPDSASLQYIRGFGSHISTEALPGTLPDRGNTPQKAPHGLYAEQVSGTSFTTPRVHNQRSWVYRILPSAKHGRFVKCDRGLIRGDFSQAVIDPNQLRWDPLPLPAADKPTTWVEGLVTFMGAGSAESKTGMAIHLYACNLSMTDEAFCNSDGDFLLVPQEGTLVVTTEMGQLEAPSGFAVVIPRGVRFSVAVEGPSRGYVAEIFEGHFQIPDLGPIGANGLANPRDFEAPVAAFEHRTAPSGPAAVKPAGADADVDDDAAAAFFTVTQKFLGELFRAKQSHSAFDVVGWHGNYFPYRYDLAKFCVVNSVSFDHLDPSIFTVLTAPTAHPGVAVCDFVIFPPRFLVQEGTFRPPYYHRNCMSEYMGNIRGVYEAKKAGFMPGGGSLHSCFIPHGPDAATFEAASNEAPQVPVKSTDAALAFMFESTYVFRLTEFAATSLVQPDYHDCWKGLKAHFKPPQPSGAADPQQ